MENKWPPMLLRISNLAMLLSGISLVVLITSIPVLFTVIRNIEEELLQSRVTYEEMANLMWKDLISEGEHFSRTRRQSYDAGAPSIQPTTINSKSSSYSSYSNGPTNEAPKRNRTVACPAGPKGVRGQKGTPGVNGMDGRPGRNGESDLGSIADLALGCLPCPPGPQGLPGYRGSRGPRGIKGNRGAPGRSGNDGNIGDAGPDGSVGHPGPPGGFGKKAGESARGFAKGAPGPRGDIGPPGSPGDEGLPGERGDDMKPGPQGPSGRMGPEGEAGPDGVPGLPGQSGGIGGNAEYCRCPERAMNPKLVAASGIVGEVPPSSADEYNGRAADSGPLPGAGAGAVLSEGTLGVDASRQEKFDAYGPSGEKSYPVDALSKAKVSKRELAKALRRKLVLL